MSKVIIIGVVILLAIGGGIFAATKLIKKDQSQSSNPLTKIIKPQETPAAAKVTPDKTYEDQVGFSFKYPAGVTVTDVTPDDPKYYSLVEIVGTGGKMKISVMDTTYKTIDEWVFKDTSVKGAELVGAASLGDIAAKQYKKDSVFYTAAIDQGVLYLIEGIKDNGYWEDVHEVVVDNFSFVGSTPKTTGGTDNTIYEAEEVVE